MTDRILCVDDEPDLLQGIQRALRKKFAIETALGPEEALKAIAESGPYAVIMADMRMPVMNGVQLLAKVREMSPDTVRMMLTGNADQQTAIDAVNDGHIFRFLNKPCPPEKIAAALEAALEQHRLIVAEKELLSKTLGGSIKILTDVLGLVNPSAFGRASRVHRIVKGMCREIVLEKQWMMEIAAMISQIGCVAVPEETLSRVYRGEALSEAEEAVYRHHPQTGRELLEKIPRLEEVADIVAHQEDLYSDICRNGTAGRSDDSVLASMILKVALDWDALIMSGLAEDLAIAEMNDRQEAYHPQIMEALRQMLKVREVHVIRRVRLHDLYDGAILADDIRSIRGTLLCAKGQEISPSMRARLKNYLINVGIQTPIKIFVSVDSEFYRLHPSDDEREASSREAETVA